METARSPPPGRHTAAPGLVDQRPKPREAAGSRGLVAGRGRSALRLVGRPLALGEQRVPRKQVMAGRIAALRYPRLMANTDIRIPPKLQKRLAKTAARRELTVEEAVTEAVEAWVRSTLSDSWVSAAAVHVSRRVGYARQDGAPPPELPHSDHQQLGAPARPTSAQERQSHVF